jgi:hypothetical protein
MALKLKKIQKNKQKAVTKYLVQERDDQDDVIYVYTDDLAKRSDMRPITEKEAQDFLKMQYPDLFEQGDDGGGDAADVTSAEAPIEVEETGAAVIADLQDAVETPEEEEYLEVPEAPPAPKTDPAVAIGVDRATDPECLLIESFTKKNQVEHYLLSVHGLEIEIGKDTKLVDLKEEAISAVIAKRM